MSDGATAAVPGSKGYERAILSFIEASQALEFSEVCSDFLRFLPDPPARVLDAGCGAGQNAAALAGRGFSVVAAEPMDAFLAAAREAYPRSDVVWLSDSLPELASIKVKDASFDFILVDGVWHHLTERERSRSLERFEGLLGPGGRCALSLRNGPPGLGTCVYPTSARDTVAEAARLDLECLLLLEDQPSMLPGKEHVVWSRVVLQKGS